jgi:excisionase family DNA binding protein
MPTEFMTVKQASVFLGMSETNVGRLGRDALIPSCKIGGARRFPLQQIREWIDARITGKDAVPRDCWIDLLR